MRLLIVVTVALSLGIASCSPGGCYWTQDNFTVTPAENCIQLIHDVCGNTDIKLSNNCSETLVVQQGDGDAGADSVTIEPGTSDTVMVLHFTDKNGHVSIPAQLGSTNVVLSWDIGRD